MFPYIIRRRFADQGFVFLPFTCLDKNNGFLPGGLVGLGPGRLWAAAQR
jgi:hypothetical protein